MTAMTPTVRRGFLMVPALCLMLGFAPDLSTQEDIVDTVKKTFKVRPGGELEIDADRGSIEILAGGGHEVRIEVIRTVGVDTREEAKQVLEAHELEFENKDDLVAITSRFDGDELSFWRSRNRFKVRMVVHVPARFDVELATGAGNIQVQDLSGTIDIATGAGSIEVASVQGPVEIRSGSGNVLVDTVVGDVEVETGAGNVSLHDVTGQVDVATGAGSVEARITAQPTEETRLESGAGSVTVYLADGVGVDVDAMSRVGTCSTDYPLRIRGKWMSKSFAGNVNGGGPDLIMRSGVGNVSLRRL